MSTHPNSNSGRATVQPPVRDDELGLLPVLRIWFGDCELWADCGNCGQAIGKPIRPPDSFDAFTIPWERHAMTLCPEKQR